MFIHNHSLILTFDNTLKQMKTESVTAIDGDRLLARAADIEIASRSLKAMSFYGIKVYCRRARMRTRFFTVSVMNARCDSLE
jgi:hypothetical protein